MFQPTMSENFNELDKYLNYLIEDNRTSGIIFLLFNKGETKFLQKYGWQDRDNRIPVEFDTIFRIYSMTKPITSIALMTLFDEGKFKLNDPISKFLPEFKKMEVFAKEENGKIITEKLEREITILDLFTHTSGLSYGFVEDDPIVKIYNEKLEFEKTRSMTLEDRIKIITTIPLRFEPGKYFRYSYSIDVLGRLIEVLSGKNLDEFFNERIFHPLNMNDTAFFVPEGKLDRFATAYTFTEEENLELAEMPWVIERFTLNNKYFSGGGGLVSTLQDYFNFAMMFLNKGKFNDKQLVKPETIELITKNHLKDNKTITELAIDERWATHPFLKAYGKGLGIRVLIRDNLFPPALGEHGWAGLAGTFYWVDPSNEVIGLFMTQVFTGGATPPIDYIRIIQLVYEGLKL